MTITKGNSNDEAVIIGFHGYGSDHNVGKALTTYHEIGDHIISFNFPDHGIRINTRDPNKIAYGTIEEILPALYVIKKCVIDGVINEVNLYGFSAGGGALVNMIAILNSERFAHHLSAVGITHADKKIMLKAIQRGHIILDCPLKSYDEVVAFRGHSREIDILTERYRKNGLRPIDSALGLDDLSLNILVHFQRGDRSLSNRDDDLFLNRLRQSNHKGNTCAIIGNDGGHLSYHASLWEHYPKFMSGQYHNFFLEITN